MEAHTQKTWSSKFANNDALLDILFEANTYKMGQTICNSLDKQLK